MNPVRRFMAPAARMPHAVAHRPGNARRSHERRQRPLGGA
jgi:hypothetical protein